MPELTEYVPGSIWLHPYPVRYAGCDFDARMTVLRLSGGRLMIHSPSPIDGPLREAIEALGTVAFIVAPGNFHHFHVPACQEAFPAARTFVCPGVERKRPDIRFDRILGDEPDPLWADDLDQVVVRGHRLISEVAFLHRATRTLVLVDVIENIGDSSPNTNWLLRFYWKYVTFMWNEAKPAPEYRFGWKDRESRRRALGRILDWDFERIVIAHGETIDTDAKVTARRAWRSFLR